MTLGDVYQAVKELERKIHMGAVIGGASAETVAGDWPKEDPEAAAALDALANL